MCYGREQEGIYDEFVKAVTKKVGEFKQGGGMDPATTLGPLINPAAVDHVRASCSNPETSSMSSYLQQTCPAR
jgi:acyl-CoA reductase-like NAD-dependent aldehyde dehydrogenase